MTSSQLSQSRLIIGLILVVVAVLLFFARTDYATAGAIAIGVLGLISIAISRK